MIENYSFGNITISGRTYNSDIIIYPDGSIQDSWWRKEGHRLTVEDIKDLLAARPQIIIVGTGSSGLMLPDKNLETELLKMGIEFKALSSKAACQAFNETYRNKKTGACFHLTC
ncbi:Mth938-like domain-containing protein [Candidatus Riflebacteria bacterium]